MADGAKETGLKAEQFCLLTLTLVQAGGCSQGSKERSRGGDAEWGALLAAGRVYRDVDLNMTFIQIAFYLDCEYRKGTQISQAEKPELLNIITGAEARDVQGSESKEGVSGFV